MIRQVIHIDEEKCNGCGICANACHEGAIDIVDGKAKLVRENFCDGFGDCLPGCPMGAITFETREAPAYDEAAVLASKAAKDAAAQAAAKTPEVSEDLKTAFLAKLKRLSPEEHQKAQSRGCPGSAMRTLKQSQAADKPASPASSTPSQLANWPPQIKLAPITAPYFAGADLLVAADCTAYTYAAFHEDFMKGRTTLIGCPKLDAIDYSEKLTAILRDNDIRSITLTRMEVPCCGGMERALRTAIAASGKNIPLDVHIIRI